MSQRLDPEDWPAIHLDGVSMPQSLKGISILVSADGLSESAGDWIWRLCHCHRVEKQGDAIWVANSARELLHFMPEHRTFILLEIQQRLQVHGFAANETYAEWIASLTQIETIARSTSGACKWIAGTASSTAEHDILIKRIQRHLNNLDPDSQNH
jgi:hypothetical protein